MASVTFKGGVHPLYFKELNEEKPIREARLSNLFTIPLTQHSGNPCEPTVAVGETVKAGQPIGASQEFFSAPVHSPVSAS